MVMERTTLFGTVIEILCRTCQAMSRKYLVNNTPTIASTLAYYK